jgi:hypothetical protein
LKRSQAHLWRQVGAFPTLRKRLRCAAPDSADWLVARAFGVLFQ